MEKVKAGELTRLCAQIDETARAPIEALIQKAQTKLAFAEKVNGYLSAKSESVDPRLEKLMAKITQMKEGPKAPNRNDAFTELFKLQNKLNNFAKHEHNPMTTEALAKARVGLGEIDMQIVNSPKVSNNVNALNLATWEPGVGLLVPPVASMTMRPISTGLLPLSFPSPLSTTIGASINSYTLNPESFPSSMLYVSGAPIIISALDALTYEMEKMNI